MSDTLWPAEAGEPAAGHGPADALTAWLWGPLPLQSLRIRSTRVVLKLSGDYLDYVIELLGPFGTVSARPMFGGHGIYLDGRMFALVSDDMLYLKSDAMNRVEFEQAGCEIFSYSRKGKRATLGFYRPPEEAMESAELMLPWARTAYAAALRVNAKKQAVANVAAPREPVQKARKAEPARAARKKPAKKKPAGPAKTTKPSKRKAPARPLKSRAA